MRRSEHSPFAKDAVEGCEALDDEETGPVARALVSLEQDRPPAGIAGARDVGHGRITDED
jgi:hypothetical protein